MGKRGGGRGKGRGGRGGAAGGPGVVFTPYKPTQKAAGRRKEVVFTPGSKMRKVAAKGNRKNMPAWKKIPVGRRKGRAAVTFQKKVAGLTPQNKMRWNMGRLSTKGKAAQDAFLKQYAKKRVQKG